MKFVAFDLETLNPAPEDHQGNYSLGITCIGACTVEDGKRETKAWHGEEVFGAYRKKMSPWECYEFVRWLLQKRDEGFDVVGWNSASFDFKVLYHEVDDMWRHKVTGLAWAHIDPFFQMLCEKGFGVSLEAVTLGMRVEGKMADMDGVKAVEMWQKSRTAQERVLEYVKQDAIATANVYEAIIHHQALRWITRRGTPSSWLPRFFRDGDVIRLMTVEEATELPLPDTSWMTNPWKREDFYDWIGVEDAEN